MTTVYKHELPESIVGALWDLSGGRVLAVKTSKQIGAGGGEVASAEIGICHGTSYWVSFQNCHFGKGH